MIYTAYSDLELLEFLKDGNEDAFSEIYHRYWKNVYKIAFKYTKSNELAEDIVQDIFLKVWNNRNHFIHVKEFKYYLFVMARNQVITTLRNNIFNIDIEIKQDIKEETLVPEQQLSFKEAMGIFKRAIESLPPQQKLAYQLSRDSGLKYEEIARRMGISISTVRIHISKAVQSIRKYLKKNDLEPIIVLFYLVKYFF